MKLTNKGNRNYSRMLFITLITLALAACGQKAGDDDSDDTDKDKTGVTGVTGAGASTTKVAEDQPSDSQGVYKAVDLTFAGSSTAAALALQTPATLTLSNGLVLSDARVNIKTIKLKANKERGASEEALKSELKALKKTWEKDIESQKQALEVEMEEIKQGYETRIEEAASEAEKETIKAEMKAEEDAFEAKKDAIEKEKDEQESQFEEDRDENIKWKGPYVYNLVAGTVSPEIPTAQVLDGSYRRIEFKIAPNHDVLVGDGLLNQSVYCAGTWNDGTADVPVTVSFPVNEKFRLMGAGALMVDAGSDAANALTIAFNLEGWFSTVDFATATKNATGEIVVSELENVAIWDLIRRNIKTSTKFGKDEDGDGELSDDEKEGDGEEGIDELEDEESEDEEEDESEDVQESE